MTGAAPRWALSRRRLLGLAAGAAAAGVAGFAVPTLGSTREPGSLLPSLLPLPTPFRVPLPIPPVPAPARHPDYPDADFHDLTDRVAHPEIVPGTRTEIWGAEGLFPGPTLVSRRGRRTVVRRRNELPVPTVNHLHGGHVPAASDGFPTDLVYPAGTGAMAGIPGMPGMPHDPLAATSVGYRDYDYPMDQRAATLWYHDHRMGFTAPDVWRGLAGFHLVHDDEEDALGLPRGDRDIPLMICDRSFGEDGSFRYPALDPTLLATPGVQSSFMDGVLGDVVLVNGAPWPVLEVSACRYRFRLLNASNARRYRLVLDPPPPGGGGLVQIGSDGGLLPRPVAHDALEIAPAERFDVVVDFSRYRAGDEITVRNAFGSGGTGAVLRFRVTGPVHDDSRIPDRLSESPGLDPALAEVTRDFRFQSRGGEWRINGELFDPARPLVTPRLGATEIWRFVTDFHHPVHLHLAQFQVLSRNGAAPGPYDAGWKDTLDLQPAEAAEVIVRFTGYRGRFVLHCHNLEHEDMAMMATVTVV
ncbi:multicopper oxidase family protein [Amycolatopsis cynarae]|uniref:Multicopper oxidase CueO n=1 Tax=Amycolatopsis cynarae TaxID=2995223 RepID=A0ABY7AVB0_9PSEU|nr:multicopper oxidase family protein [Amycolatopsis sp. HUAS 11-8]WAL63876.1 multicopper oxidase family protein [Amycolatopsis sp. HUAS 11-8]